MALPGVKRGPYKKRFTAAERLTALGVRASNGCLEFTGSLNNQGYGQFNIGGRLYLAHRASFELSGRVIPTGLFLLHKCDNPKCIEPDHLEPGTQSQNLKDMADKGRMGRNRFQNIGRVNYWHAKLTEEDVSDIRVLRSFGLTQTAIALEYGVTQSSICNRLSERRRVAL